VLVGLLLVQLMQEPDSFSQSLIRLLKLTHSSMQTREFRVLRSTFTRTLTLDTGQLLSRGHNTTLSRDQPTVEITLEHRRPPPTKTAIRDPLTRKPRTLQTIRLNLIRTHELTDLLHRQPRTNRQPNQLPH